MTKQESIGLTELIGIRNPGIQSGNGIGIPIPILFWNPGIRESVNLCCQSVNYFRNSVVSALLTFSACKIIIYQHPTNMSVNKIKLANLISIQAIEIVFGYGVLRIFLDRHQWNHVLQNKFI